MHGVSANFVGLPAARAALERTEHGVAARTVEGGHE
jgi:hypothetical protein